MKNKIDISEEGMKITNPCGITTHFNGNGCWATDSKGKLLTPSKTQALIDKYEKEVKIKSV